MRTSSYINPYAFASCTEKTNKRILLIGQLLINEFYCTYSISSISGGARDSEYPDALPIPRL